MKLGSATKVYKRNKTTSKKVDGDVLSANCGVIIIILTYGQFGAGFRTHGQ